jgi:hypothetical protein
MAEMSKMQEQFSTPQANTCHAAFSRVTAKDGGNAEHAGAISAAYPRHSQLSRASMRWAW